MGQQMTWEDCQRLKESPELPQSGLRPESSGDRLSESLEIPRAAKAQIGGARVRRIGSARTQTVTIAIARMAKK